MFNLAISNIAWTLEKDNEVFGFMKEMGFAGLEIAPTRVFPQAPYDHIEEAEEWSRAIKREYDFTIPSMQSIWFGRNEKIYGSEEERRILEEYTKKAILFAEAIACGNLVFGCPRNRVIPDEADPYIAVSFFKAMGDFAYEHHTIIGFEPNPPIYHTNYINTTDQALELIREVDSSGFRLNLDVGTMIENGESVESLKGSEQLINHVHISEPGLIPITEHKLHKELAEFLVTVSYDRYVSIEVGCQDDIGKLKRMMESVVDVFR